VTGRTVEHLMTDVAFALEHGLDARDLVPMLQTLANRAEPGSEASRFARLHLARHMLRSSPFRAARLSYSVTVEEPQNDEAWGLYGLSLTVLGHFRAAKRALFQATTLAPRHPGHAHNLGHLLDVGFNRPKSALPWLERAFNLAKDVPSIACSYAHALCRTGRGKNAFDVLRRYGSMDAESASMTLEQWSQNSPKSTGPR
jgi:predicted Zn-dependent protease